MSAKLVIVAATAPVVTLLDRLSKSWVEQNVSPIDGIEVIEGFFSITHARNPGAALGLFQDLNWGVFVALGVLALGLIAWFYRDLADDDRLPAAALGLIVGGALGNLYDRVMSAQHAVIDFLHFDFGLFVFPDFNLADSAIVVGVALLLLDSATRDAEDSAPAPEPPAEPLA